jgi:hypothetical protein
LQDEVIIVTKRLYAADAAVPPMEPTNDKAPIHFEEPAIRPPSYAESKPPKLAGLIIKFSGGTIQSVAAAEYVMIGFVIILVGISLYFLFAPHTRAPSNTIIIAPGESVGSPQGRPQQ